MSTVRKLHKTISTLRSAKWVEELDRIGETYIVGGVVRDIFRDAEIKDVDLVVAGTTLDQIKEVLAGHGKVNIVGESFSVIKFRPEGHVGEDYDIAVPRKDRKIGDTHKDFEVVTDGVSLLDDLKRRDLTINSIAMRVRDMFIVDPFDGIGDIANEKIRATDINSFVDDPLRIMRAIQFAARFGFVVEDDTLQLMKTSVDLIKTVSRERIHEELLKVINKNGNARLTVQLMNTVGASDVIIGKKVDPKSIFISRQMDAASFFYILCMGDVNPAEFYKRTFKGENAIEITISQLHELHKADEEDSERKYRFLVFNLLKKQSYIRSCTLLPTRAKEVFRMMDSGKIPKRAAEIRVNGDDVLSAFPNFSGQQVGNLLSDIYMGALTGSFNWKNRRDSLAHMKLIGEITERVNFHMTNTD